MRQRNWVIDLNNRYIEKTQQILKNDLAVFWYDIFLEIVGFLRESSIFIKTLKNQKF